MDDADPKLEAGTQPVYDHVRRSSGGLHLTPGSYTEIFTGSVAQVDQANPIFAKGDQVILVYGYPSRLIANPD
jgi:hypothetical protein